jgi:hypothetical protein
MSQKDKYENWGYNPFARGYDFIYVRKMEAEMNDLGR